MILMDSKLKEKLGKLYQLAKKGVGGEKENAEKFLKKLLDKHGLTIEDLEKEEKVDKFYNYTSIKSRELIHQIVYHVIGKDMITWNIPTYKCVGVEATNYQHIQIKELVLFHLENMKIKKKKFLETFYSAYVQKHSLFPPKELSNKEDEEEELSREDWENIEKVLAFKNMMGGATFVKKIGDGNQ